MEAKKGKGNIPDWQSLERELRETRMMLKEVILQVKELTSEVGRTARPTLNRKEAAEFLGISVSTMNIYCSRKVIPYYWSRQGMTYFDKEDLLAFMHETEVKAEDIARQNAIDRIYMKRLRSVEPAKKLKL